MQSKSPFTFALLLSLSINITAGAQAIIKSKATSNMPVSEQPKSIFVNVGLGFQGNRFHTSTWTPSFNIHTGYDFIKNATAGIEASYYREKIAKNSSFTSFSAGFRGSYYFNTLLKRETRKNKYYAGFGVFYYRFKYTNFSSVNGKVFIPIHVGVRRFFYKNYGANLELSANDMGFIKVGVFTKL